MLSSPPLMYTPTCVCLDSLDPTCPCMPPPICTPSRADLEHTNKKGLTPLQLAVRSGHLGVTEELLTRGARPNVKSKAGLCLRCLASSMGHGYLVVSTACIEKQS